MKETNTNIKIEIPIEDAGYFKSYFEAKLAEKETELQAKQKEVDELRGILSGILGGVKSTVVREENHFFSGHEPSKIIDKSLNGYNKQWTNFEKTEYLLKRKGPLTTSEIVDFIIENEPEKNTPKDLLVKTFSSILSKAFKNGELKRVEGKRGTAKYYI